MKLQEAREALAKVANNDLPTDEWLKSSILSIGSGIAGFIKGAVICALIFGGVYWAVEVSNEKARTTTRPEPAKVEPIKVEPQGAKAVNRTDQLISSAKSGDSSAQFELGLYYYDQGTNKTLEDSLYWLGKASAAGNEEATSFLTPIKTQLAQEAMDFFTQGSYDPFLDLKDPDLLLVGRSISGIKRQTSYPSSVDCDSILKSCLILLQKHNVDRDMVRVLLGSKLLIEYEQQMLRQGFVRYNEVFVNAKALQQQRRNKIEQERQSRPVSDKEYLKAYAAQIAEAMVNNGTVESATLLGPPQVDYLSHSGITEANAMVPFEWNFWTKAGFQRRTAGYLFFYKENGKWIHNPIGDHIDGMPYFK